MGRAIGIDLGTTYSAMAFVERGEPEIIPNAEGERTTPSVIAIKDGELMVGSTAKRQMAMNTQGTLFGVKRLMGRRFSDEKSREFAATVPFLVEAAANDGVSLSVHGETYLPEEVGARILRKLKTDAEEYLGEDVTDAAITVPAYFDSAQREATKAAGEIAGMNVLRIISEPTAAAFAYGLAMQKAASTSDDDTTTAPNARTIAVYDLGGGTFDCSVLKIHDGVFDVVATSGDPFLGGEDFDLRLADHVLTAFRRAENIDLSSDPAALARVREACETAKRELSSLTATNVTLPYIQPGANLDERIERDLLEELVGDLVARTISVCGDALQEARLDPGDLDDVLLIGGQTRSPVVRQAVEDFFGRRPLQTINPDEAVALGAAIQTGVLRDEIDEEVLLLDVTAVTLGTSAIVDGVPEMFSPIIPRNTTIPTRQTERYFTVQDNQTQMLVDVLQGEEPRAADNKELGRFVLVGISRGPAPQPVDLTYEIDADGIISAKAVDPETGAENEIKIENAPGLTQKQIAEMAKRAASEDSTDP